MNRNNGKFYIAIAAALLMILLIAMPLNIRGKLKNDIRLFEGQEHLLQLQLPLDLYIRADKPGIIDLNAPPARGGKYSRLSWRNDLSLTGLSSGSVNLEFSLFNGLIPIRQLTVSVLPEKEVVVGGHS
ncbi:MAG: hypothetical protein AB1796_06420, partial [Bacillota bacterium]